MSIKEALYHLREAIHELELLQEPQLQASIDYYRRRAHELENEAKKLEKDLAEKRLELARVALEYGKGLKNES